MRKIAVILCLMLLVWNLQAQEDKTVALQQNNEKRMNLEGGFHFGDMKDGAFIGFGVLLYNKGSWNIRSHTGVDSYILTINGASSEVLNITEKITAIGIMNDIGIGRPYGYIDGGICLYKNQSKEELFSTPLWYKFGFGFGVDINIIRDIAWYSEVGLASHFIENNRQIWTTLFVTGLRFYL